MMDYAKLNYENTSYQINIPFYQMSDQIKKWVQPYIQPIPPEQVLIGVIIFYVVFSLAFFMADHSNAEFAANIIGLYNSFITMTAMSLYLITANVFCCVIAVASCLASYLAEMVLGPLYLPSGISPRLWTKYLHHICYITIITCCLYWGFELFAVAMFIMGVEISTCLSFIKRIWKIRNKWFDMIYAFAFFLTRIVLWISVIYIVYSLTETTTEKIYVGIVSLFTVVHIGWTWMQVQNFIRRYVSRNEVPTSTR